MNASASSSSTRRSSSAPVETSVGRKPSSASPRSSRRLQLGVVLEDRDRGLRHSSRSIVARPVVHHTAASPFRRHRQLRPASAHDRCAIRPGARGTRRGGRTQWLRRHRQQERVFDELVPDRADVDAVEHRPGRAAAGRAPGGGELGRNGRHPRQPGLPRLPQPARRLLDQVPRGLGADGARRPGHLPGQEQHRPRRRRPGAAAPTVASVRREPRRHLQRCASSSAPAGR